MYWDTLTEHALNNVWCSPGQDNQLIFAPKRISRQGGAIGFTKVVYRSIALPQRSKYYHVYQIGQIDPRLVGLLYDGDLWVSERWFTFAEAVNQKSVEITTYAASGVVYPRYKSYFMFTRERALIFAFEKDDRIPIDFDHDNLYVRLYSNAYFQTGEGSAGDKRMYTSGLEPDSSSSIMYIQTVISQLREKTGLVKCWRNGVLVSDISLVNCKPNDCLEWVYDSSVKRVVTFDVDKLFAFHSSLDRSQKYLLHHQQLATDTIDFQDDVDVFVTDNTGVGLYVNRNHGRNHRMLTHRDYSVSADVISSVGVQLQQLLNDPKRALYLQMHVREGGYHRKLIKDNNRIFELYKLPPDRIVSAMTGIDATVPEWSCDGLESCGYTELMRTNQTDVNIDLVEDAYGYNSICQIVGDSPLRLNASGMVELKQAQTSLSTIFEYDKDGLFLGAHTHNLGLYHYRVDPLATMIEAIPAKGSDSPDVVYGRDNLIMPVGYDYRVYHCHVVYGDPTEVWTDISQFEGVKFRIEDGVLKWIEGSEDQYLMVRSDNTFLMRRVITAGNEGLINFTLMEITTRDGVARDRNLAVPGAQIDIIINGHSGVEGVDYIVEFPVVYITSTRYLKQPVFSVTQDIFYRVLGFCGEDLQAHATVDRGWVQYGTLSNNHRFDLRDDKVQRITVGGKLVHKDTLKFMEDQPQIIVDDALNGLPYEIKDVMVPIGRYVKTRPSLLRDKAVAIDQRVGDYLTRFMAPAVIDKPNVISEIYPQVSPFFSHLIFRLETGGITIDPSDPLSASQVLAICKPYESLLQWDPISNRNRQDPNYVYIAPIYGNTVKVLDYHQFRFINRVVSIYADNRIKLSPFIQYKLQS